MNPNEPSHPPFSFGKMINVNDEPQDSMHNENNRQENTDENIEIDAFDQIVDMLVTLRNDIKTLKRTSLNKKEAEYLHDILIKNVEDMNSAASGVNAAIDSKLLNFSTSIKNSAVRAARDAATEAVKDSHVEIRRGAEQLLTAARETQKEAWRRFGGFWLWLTAATAIGAVCGLLLALLIMPQGDAAILGHFPERYCSLAGGQIVEQDDGSSFCAVLITPSF